MKGLIKQILKSSDNPEKVFNMLGNNIKELVLELTPNDIEKILNMTFNPDLVKDLLRKYGHKI